MRTFPRLNAALLCFALMLASVTPAFASNGAALTTIGNKGPVSVPVYGDGFTAYRMPSSIGWALDSQVDLAAFFFYSRTTFINTQNNYTGEGGTIGGNVGAVFALGRPDFDEDPDAFDDYDYAGKWTLHIGEYVEIAGAGGETPIRNIEYPETIDLGTGIVFLTTAFTVAYTPTEWLSVAFQFDVYKGILNSKTLSDSGSGSLNGSPTIAGVPVPGNPTYQDFLGLFDTGAAGDPNTYFEANLYSLQLGFTIAATVRPTDNFAIGFSYAPRSVVVRDFEGEAEVDATRTFNSAVGGLSPAIQTLFFDTLPNQGNNGFVNNYDVTITGIRVPRRIRGSVAWWPIPQLLVSAEVAWIEWARALQQAKVLLRNGDNTDVNFVIGGNSVNTELTPRLANQWIFSLYSAFAVTDFLRLRAGFNYGENALNVRETGNGPSAGFVETHVMLGFGVDVVKGLEVGILAEYAFEVHERSDGSPTSLTARNTRYTAEQFFLHFGVSYKF